MFIAWVLLDLLHKATCLDMSGVAMVMPVFSPVVMHKPVRHANASKHVLIWGHGQSRLADCFYYYCY